VTARALVLLIVVAAVLAAFALLSRVGLVAEYSGGGLRVWLKIGFVKIPLYPPKKDRAEKGGAGRAGDGPAGAGEGGDAGKLKKNLPIIREVLGKLKGKLSIDRLIVRYLSACEDPAEAALAFGAASAGAGLLLPIIENNFRVRRKDIRTGVSFTEKKSSLYLFAQATLAVYHLYGALALLKVFMVKKNKRN